jgi:(E)-4-hydroxy-3-methylbut-2-enyl-diphosphate synthase
MCATRTQDIRATLRQIHLLEESGADIIRIAIDSPKDVEALREIRKETRANLVVDLQENYRLAKEVAPIVEKFRYNPGHLHHHQKNVPLRDKVRFLVETAGEHDCAIRIGVNFGSLDPKLKESAESHRHAAVTSAIQHCDMLEELGFFRFVVSLKSSDPYAVMEINREFARLRPEVPLHLGVTEAGLLPDAEIKTRLAVEQLLSEGIGETLRVSLTLPDEEKWREIDTARRIIADVADGRFITVPKNFGSGLNVISCPSCSRVENAQFVKLAEEVKRVTEYAREHRLTIAVMGCRVNGPGETDDADLGLWCAANFVNLKKGQELIGSYRYDEVIPVLIRHVDELIATRPVQS